MGNFGFDLITDNEQITTEPGDLVLYQGNQLVIFYGKIHGVTQGLEKYRMSRQKN